MFTFITEQILNPQVPSRWIDCPFYSFGGHISLAFFYCHLYVELAVAFQVGDHVIPVDDIDVSVMFYLFGLNLALTFTLSVITLVHRCATLSRSV